LRQSESFIDAIYLSPAADQERVRTRSCDQPPWCGSRYRRFGSSLRRSPTCPEERDDYFQPRTLCAQLPHSRYLGYRREGKTVGCLALPGRIRASAPRWFGTRLRGRLATERQCGCALHL